MLLQEKEHNLEGILARYKRVAVAFSGGADSSLLAKKALEVLGPENVLLLTARSRLIKQSEMDHAASWLFRHGYEEQVAHEFIDMEHFSWDEFVQNPPGRCYLCKMHLYRLFAGVSDQHGIDQLIDGTNDDDMHSTRPGLRALRELGIGTPLADAGLTKNEVRSLSRELQLDTWNRPSSSCLATRIPDGLEITEKRVSLIEKLETFLESIGFKGCRVRLDRHKSDTVYLQVLEKDIAGVVMAASRPGILHFFNDSGMKRIFMDLNGRSV